MPATGYQPAAFLDDNPLMHKSIIHSKKIYGNLSQLNKALEASNAELIVRSIGDLNPEKSREVFRAGMKRGIHVLLAKGVGNAFDNGASNQLNLQDMTLEDLLCRPSRNLDDHPVREMLSGRCILVTGAGGSIGSDICRQCSQKGIRELHVLDHSEFALFSILGELQKTSPNYTSFLTSHRYVTRVLLMLYWLPQNPTWFFKPLLTNTKPIHYPACAIVF